MPLTGSEPALAAVLKPEIIAQLQIVFTFHPEIAFSSNVLDKFAEAIAKAVANKVVPHIIENALVHTDVIGVQNGPDDKLDQIGEIL